MLKHGMGLNLNESVRRKSQQNETYINQVHPPLSLPLPLSSYFFYLSLNALSLYLPISVSDLSYRSLL